MPELIESAVAYSNKVITGLLEYSGDMRLNLAETTLKSLTEGALLQVRIPENIDARDFTEDQPTLGAGEEKAQRVFVNLIENAVDAMPNGGELTISVKESNGNLGIKFTDTGKGMTRKKLENIWKQLHTTKAKGIGLGLAICKRAMEAHGCLVSVESEVGKGTTFTVELPVTMKKEG
jgi:signal transduction histidine kinase